MSSEPSAVKRIKEGHRLLEKALLLLSQASEHASLQRQRRNFQVLRERLLQLEGIVGTEFHASQNKTLLSLIVLRCPALKPVLDRLRTEHSRGVLLVRALIVKLEVWESTGELHGAGFHAALRTCREIYDGCMQVEENYVLPVAMDYLSESDWVAIDLSIFDRGDGEFLH